MGVVYAAHDDRLDRPVAIKVVRPDVLADGAALTRFRREARAAARISLNGARRFNAIMLSQTSSVVASSVPLAMMPAAFTSTSMAP